MLEVTVRHLESEKEGWMTWFVRVGLVVGAAGAGEANAAEIRVKVARKEK